MPRKKLPYREGDWFAVPLGCGGYALGLAAHVSKSGLILAYFFRPRYEGIPAIDEVGGKELEDAVAVARVSELGILEGVWKVLGRLEPWTPSKWPFPVFGRYDEVTRRAWRVNYEEDLDGVGRDERASIEEARSLPRDGLWGYVAAEDLLTDLLCEGEARVARIEIPTGSGRESPAASIEGDLTGDDRQAVLLWVRLSDERFGTAENRQKAFDLEDELMAAVEQSSAGEYDGHEFGEGWCTIFIYGPNAEDLHRVIAPVLARTPLPSGSYVVKRYGGPGAKEEKITL